MPETSDVPKLTRELIDQVRGEIADPARRDFPALQSLLSAFSSLARKGEAAWPKPIADWLATESVPQHDGSALSCLLCYVNTWTALPHNPAALTPPLREPMLTSLRRLASLM